MILNDIPHIYIHRRRFGNPDLFVPAMRYQRWLDDPDGKTFVCQQCEGKGVESEFLIQPL